MIQKLQLKFIIINMSIVTVMLSIILGLIYYFTLADIETNDITMMLDIFETPSQLITPANSSDTISLPFFVLERDENGELNAIGSYFDLTDESFLEEIFNLVIQTGEDTGIIDEYFLRYLIVSTPPSQTIVFLDITSEVAVLNNLIKSCAVIGIFSFLVFLALSFFLARWATSPVERAWKQQHQFVADASHELKTPITVIMANAEFLQNPIYSDEERVRFTGAILTMAKQMRTLVEQLLVLAMADTAQSKLVFYETDLSRLLSDAVLPFEPVFFEKGLAIQTDIEPNIFIHADIDKLHQVIDILLDNAQKYSCSGTTTYIKLCQRGKSKILLTVANEGDEIPPEDLQNLFRRFYRADEARSRDGSFGLGLSIAETIVTQHNGKIWAESKNKMNTFYVELRDCR